MSETQLIRCPSCGATNRVSQEAKEKIAGGLAPVCGRCKAPLSADNRPVTVTDATFSAEVEHSPLPVVLDLWAAWCGPCRMISPVLEDLAKRHAGHLKVVKVDVDANQGLASKFGANSIPLLVVIREGKEVDRIVGALPRAALEQRLGPILAQ
jgi:thioredoxin 2